MIHGLDGSDEVANGLIVAANGAYVCGFLISPLHCSNVNHILNMHIENAVYKNHYHYLETMGLYHLPPEI